MSGADPVFGHYALGAGAPDRLFGYYGIAGGHSSDDEQNSGRMDLGVSELLLPQIGFLDLTAEGSVGFIGSELGGAFSSYLKFPYFNPGIEYNGDG